MNKLKFSLIGLFLLSQAIPLAQAEEQPLLCNGEANFQGSYVDLMCTNGSCSGWVPAQRVRVRGKCNSEKDIDYVAEGIVTAIYVRGICKGGVVTVNSFAQNVILYGSCTFEDNFYGAFSSSVYSPSSFASGFCQENGMSRLYHEGISRPVQGQCRPE